MKQPDVLVLGVGGTLGEAWLSGFLAGVEQRSGLDFRQAAHFVGTSAGSIVAARLAAGRSPRRPGDPGGLAQRAPSASVSTASNALGRLTRVPLDGLLPAVGATLRAAQPARALARAALLARLPRGRMPLDDLRARIAALGPRFDGRLRVVAVDASTGRRVVFGAPGAPDADVADAVAASCAVPGLFRPVRIGDRNYVDGGVWSPANLDVAPVQPGTHVLCLVPTAALAAGNGIAARALARNWQVATAVEAAAARRHGAHVTVIGPNADASRAMGADLMNASRRDQVANAGFTQGIATAAAALPAAADSRQRTGLPHGPHHRPCPARISADRRSNQAWADSGRAAHNLECDVRSIASGRMRGAWKWSGCGSVPGDRRAGPSGV